MPTPRKSIEQKRRTGNPGKRALPAVTGTLALAPAYDPGLWELKPHEALERVLTEGSVWLAYTDSVMLSVLRETLDLRINLVERAVRGDLDAFRMLGPLDDRVHKLLSELGFSPTARARLGVAEVKARTGLETLRDRAAKVANQGQSDGKTAG